jgi:hypothetical protein
MDGATMTASEPASGASTPDLSSVTHVTVEEKNTVGAMVPGMPYVAATPYLVGVAEMACSRLVKDLLEPGQVTVGSRVVIDHLGPSKVGAELVIKSALLQSLQVFRHHRGRPANRCQGRARTCRRFAGKDDAGVGVRG